jgi:hypothetical protein
MLADNVQNAAANVDRAVRADQLRALAREQRGRPGGPGRPVPQRQRHAVVYRNGYAIPGTWHRSTLGSPTQFVNDFGVPIPMQPGQTWVELVPNTIMATTTP